MPARKAKSTEVCSSFRMNSEPKHKILLSICIPTMDRKQFLEQALSTISSQLTPKIRDRMELCVLDGGRDSAKDVVSAFGKKSKMAIYYVHDTKRIGVDRSIMRVAEMASGKFCWFFGDDDIFEQGSFSRLLPILDSNDGTVFFQLNRYLYSFDLKMRWSSRPPIGGWNGIFKDMSFSGRKDIEKFISLFFIILSYLGTQIVERKTYLSTIRVAGDLSKYCTDYALAYVVCRMLAANPKARFISEPYVGCRMDNESTFSISSSNPGKEIDPVWFERVTGENFRKVAQDALSVFSPRVYSEVKAALGGIHVPMMILALKGAKMHFSKKLAVWAKVISVYYDVPQFWIRTFPFIIMPQPLFFLLRKINQTVVKPSTAIKA